LRLRKVHRPADRGHIFWRGPVHSYLGNRKAVCHVEIVKPNGQANRRAAPMHAKLKPYAGPSG
jgi:hypothetical protein